MAKAAPAPLSASLLAVPKGAAAPAAEVTSEARVGQGPDVPPQQPRLEPARRAARPRAARAAPRRTPEPAPPPVDEPRTALTVRLPLSTQERLREAAHRTRREKQVIVDEALAGWLDAHGF